MNEKAIPQNVIKALARVRESGAYNMFDRNGVINSIALDDNADWNAAEWLTDNKARYMEALNAMGAWISRPDFDPSDLDDDEPTIEPIEFSDAHDPMTEAAKEIVRRENTPTEPQPADTRARSRFYGAQSWHTDNMSATTGDNVDDPQPPANDGAVEATGAPVCPICGNWPVEPGYRVCPSCVSAREHAPHYWIDEPPDKLSDTQPASDGVVEAQSAPATERALRDEVERLRAENEQLRQDLAHWRTEASNLPGLDI